MSRKRLFAALVLAAGIPWVGRTAPTLLNGVAAIANESVITFEEVQMFTRRSMEAAARKSRTQAEFDQDALKIQNSGLEDLIDRRLVVGEFKTSGFQLPESIIDELVKERVKKDFGDRVTLTKQLRQDGRTYESFRQEERDALVVYQMMRKNVLQEVVVSPRKLERYYAQNQEKYRVGDRARVRMILIDSQKHARGEPVKIAQEALVRIKAGADFATVANEVSDDARSYKGGDRGWIEAQGTVIRKELREIAFKLEPGQITDVIDLDGAAFIVKLEEKQTAQIRPLTEMRTEIEATLKQEEQDRLRKAWLARIRKKSYVARF